MTHRQDEKAPKEQSMHFRFKHQQFQADAARAVVGVFAGQPNLDASHRMDPGVNPSRQMEFQYADGDLGWGNHPIVPELGNAQILENLRKIQRENGLRPSERLEWPKGQEGRYNLTIEMETGVGKTYTYIKTMYELNQAYGWRKFIVVVPSIAIREGVYKSFQMTADHFTEEYGRRIHFFIYDSRRLAEIASFAQSNSICAMIINSQAFNASGKDARRIGMKLDEFQSRKPIDVIARTNPILVIDEPQSVEGAQTKENLKEFCPLLTLRYSATHRKDSIYNMVYRLDAMKAYNEHLVKKIAVKGITESVTTGTDGYVYLEGVNLSKAAPTATLQFECRGASGVRKITRIVDKGYDLYANSGELEEYKDRFVVTEIDGRDNSVSFANGTKIFAGDVIGKVSEEQLRRIQIRETILSHLQREQALFRKGIKVLSLFFIDEVDKYRQYDAANRQAKGLYAQIFEEEYADVLKHFQFSLRDADYQKYLDGIDVERTHAGYFSIDKKGDSKLDRKTEKTSDDQSAYDLIMKDKERLLSFEEPVRFIFSHSALREGWDNPNVFQICTLKQSSSEVRKRQEVGRGLRLCVNQEGERMDNVALGQEVQDVNVLTVIASESYDSFAKALQSEYAEAVADRPRMVDAALFNGQVLKDANGGELVVDKILANNIFFDLRVKGYVDQKCALTEKYHADKANGCLDLPPEVSSFQDSVVAILDSVYNERALRPENARSDNLELKVDPDRLQAKEFQELWRRINAKTVYVVSFDTDQLVRNAIVALDKKLVVSKLYFKVESGVMGQIESREQLEKGDAFVQEGEKEYKYDADAASASAASRVKYDLVGKLVELTSLTRKDVIRILRGIEPYTFGKFRDNPEEFIARAANLINEEKATAIIEHIAYNLTEERYTTDVFTEPTIRGRLNYNAIKTKKHLYDAVVYDSDNEKRFAEKLDAADDVKVYVKLPKGFYISTPVGRYNPDWAIAFREGAVKHVYFVAETKGSLSSMDIRPIEKAKIQCAHEHFRTISTDQVQYEVVDSYETLLKMVK